MNVMFSDDANAIASHLQNHPESINSWYQGYTPLSNPCACDRVDVVDVILEFAASHPQYNVVNYKHNEDSETALCAAAGNGNIDIVSRLLHHGARTDLCSLTPLHHVTKYRRYGEDAMYFHNWNPPDHYTHCINLLIPCSDVNATDSFGDTPFMNACRHDTIDAANALIDYVTDINHVNNAGQSAIFNVSNPDIFNLLVAKGANVNLLDNEGNTPYSFLCTFCDGTPQQLKDAMIAAGCV